MTMKTPDDAQEAVRQAETYLRWRRELEDLRAQVPGMTQAMEQAAHTTAVAIECGFLRPESVQAIRDALAFAEEMAAERDDEGGGDD
jgi:hypothetical protein